MAFTMTGVNSIKDNHLSIQQLSAQKLTDVQEKLRTLTTKSVASTMPLSKCLKVLVGSKE